MTQALLLMDLQNGVVERYPAGKRDLVIAQAVVARQAARERGVPVIYVRLAFRADAPEISRRNVLFSRLSTLPEFRDDNVGTLMHKDVEPGPGEIVVLKKRASAFVGSDLAQVTAALGITHLVSTGIATSGVVLSTVRDAADRDYEQTVLSDASADPDDDVHRTLCEKVFPMQARVVTTAEWVASL